ncbi:hypothetical protein C8R43DRAFT_232486 [Mycena crocata]|nr:hypothetical protein C8R43DRAFT_232486 [Mycena crocata]
MPPALRPTPSAPGPSTPRASTGTNTRPTTDSSETPANTPRKSPHCKTCGRPRKGHPLRACESVDSPRKDATGSPVVNSPTSNLIDALGALDFVDRDRKEKRARRQSERPRTLQSLPSISTVTGELLDSLKAPGLLDDDGSEYGGDDAEKRDVVIRWRETSSIPPTKGASVQNDSSGAPPPSTAPSVPKYPSPTVIADKTPTKKRVPGLVGK